MVSARGYHTVIRASSIPVPVIVVPVKNIPSPNGGLIIYQTVPNQLSEPVRFKISTPLSILYDLYFFKLFNDDKSTCREPERRYESIISLPFLKTNNKEAWLWTIGSNSSPHLIARCANIHSCHIPSSALSTYQRCM